LFIGAIMDRSENVIFENNTFNVAPYTTINSNVVQLSSGVNGTVTGNAIYGDKAGTLLLLSNVKGVNSPYLVANNFLWSGDSTSAAGASALHIQDANTANVIVANNSISHYGDAGSKSAILVLDGLGVKVYNNNIGAFGSSPAMRIEKSYSLTESDHNNFYSSNGAFIHYAGSDYANLSAWQTAQGKDAASMSVNPGFTGSDLHTCAAALNGAAMPLSYITEDIDGDLRQSTPDIGADEFMGGSEGLVASDNIDKCASETVLIGAPAMSGVSYSWNPTGDVSSEVLTSTAGQYIVTATGACGTFSDTVNVVDKPNPSAGFNIYAGVGLAVSLNNTSTNGLSYHWDFGDGNSSTDASPTHIYESEDTYVITLTVFGECDTVTITQTYTAIANSTETFGEGSISLYPNPATENVQLSFENISLSNATLQIFDMTGKTVYSTSLENVSNQITVPVQQLNPGMYQIMVRSADQSATLKFIKK
jgi:PKD repeat protein